MFIFTFYWMVSVSWVVSVVSHSIGWHYNTMMVMVVWHPYSSTKVLVLALHTTHCFVGPKSQLGGITWVSSGGGGGVASRFPNNDGVLLSVDPN